MIGVSLLVFFSLINVPLSLLTVALGHVVYSIPLVVLVVSARLLSLNPNLERASLDLGADRPTTFKNITLPLIYPAVSVAGLIVFLWSFDNFIITFFTIGSDITFPIWMWGAIRRPTNLPNIMAASSIIIIVGSLLVYFIERYRIKRGLFTSGVF
jgi:spermidine/putrescine transport system permease protein